MSEGPVAPFDPVAPELQFDRAELDQPAPQSVSCTLCQRPIASRYYEAGGQTVCEACRDGLLVARDAGSRIGRFGRATLFGVGAAALGSGIWYGVSKLTGYEFGLIAILIGLLVGGAVRTGGRRRGGWAYQALAMFLTYASIVSTYIPPILAGMQEAAQEDGADDAAAAEVGDANAAAATNPDAGAASTASATSSDAGAANAAVDATAADAPAGDPAAAVAPEPVADADAAAAAVTATPPPDEGSTFFAGHPFLAFFVAAALLLAIAFAAPFLAGFQNFMGWIILAIGLYEAWKLNKKQALVFAGPFAVGGGRPIAPERAPEPPPAPLTP